MFRPKKGHEFMLGRKNFTQEELDHSKAEINAQLATYKALCKAISAAPSDMKVDAALTAFEARFFNNMVLALDRPFVHRVRMVTGKDGNPLNEVEMLCDSLMNNNGVLLSSNVIKLIPEQSVVGLNVGDTIALSARDFERLSTAFFDEIERKFL
jgi:hypothetical protein